MRRFACYALAVYFVLGRLNAWTWWATRPDTQADTPAGVSLERA